MPPCSAARLAAVSARAAGTVLHDWGAHLVDQALQLGFGPCRRVSAWLIPAPWPGVDTGGHGRVMLEFDNELFVHIESSRICLIDRPRWWILGSAGGFVKYGIDPQEQALRAGDIDRASEPPDHIGRIRTAKESGETEEALYPTVQSHWDSYYGNIAEHLTANVPLDVSAEEGREVVRLLEAAEHSAVTHAPVEGSWGNASGSLSK